MREASLGRLRPLLPNEPCLHLPAAERALSERHLLPVLAELEAFFMAVRLQLDPALERLQPVKLGKPYPLGQCLEIERNLKDSHFCVTQPPPFARVRP